jgi:hypothetical protein
MTRKNKRVGITMTYVGHETTEELDFKTRDEILDSGWGENNDYPLTITKGDTGRNYEGDSYAMSIISLEKILTKLKKKGANYVEIMYHCDHIEYEINGLEVHKTTPEEFIEYDEMVKTATEEAKKKEIAKLQNQLKKLKGETND